MYLSIYTYIYMYPYICMYIKIDNYIWIFIYMYIYIWIDDSVYHLYIFWARSAVFCIYFYIKECF